MVETFARDQKMPPMEDGGESLALRDSVGLGRDSFVIDEPALEDRQSRFEDDLKSIDASMASLLNDLGSSSQDMNAPVRKPSRVKRVHSSQTDSMNSSQGLLQSITLSDMKSTLYEPTPYTEIMEGSGISASCVPYVSALVGGSDRRHYSSSSSNISMSISLTDVADEVLRPRTMSEMNNSSGSGSRDTLTSSTCMELASVLHGSVLEGGMISEEGPTD